MCANLFSKPKAPKIQQVAPAPQAVTQPETKAINDQAKKNRQQKLAAQGADWARNQADDSLLSKAQSGTKQRLGD